MARYFKPHGEVDPLVGPLGELRPTDPLRCAPFETFYQAGYQAALAAAEKPSVVPPLFRCSYPIALGGLSGAALATVLMWFCLGPFPPSVELESFNPSLATLPEVMSSEVVSSEAAPLQAEAADQDRIAQTDGMPDTSLDLTDEKRFQPSEEIASFINRSFGHLFGSNSDSVDRMAITGVPSEASASQIAGIATAKSLSRQSSWQPLMSAGTMRFKTRFSADSAELRKDASPDSSRPSQPAATVWQLRQHPDLLTL